MPRNQLLTNPTTIPPTTATTALAAGDTNSLPKKPPAYDYFDEPTIYAQIDHYKTSSSAATSPFPPLISPSSTISTSLYPAKPFSREIVTIRTPLMYTQQESCV